MIKVKICGLTRQCDIDVVNVEKPDYVGFVFAHSRRRVTPAKAIELRSKLANGITPVGVFVDEMIENILPLVQNDVIKMVQLHGLENEEYIVKLKELTTVPIIKAVSVQCVGDVQKWESTAADYLLLDNKGGGTGQAFDWSLIGKVTKPYFLAGGLDISNIENAIKQTTAFAVDVSSGVETNGFKDSEKIKEFITTLRFVETQLNDFCHAKAFLLKSCFQEG